MAVTETPPATDYDRQPKVEVISTSLVRKLHEVWETEPGIMGWIGTVDHKEIGIRYIVTAFAFLVAGGIEALIMRLQLAEPNSSVVTPGAYDQLFSMHGITMIFLYALPILSGFSNFLFPLVLGSRDMAFPRLNAFSYWVYLASGIFLYCSFAVGAAPNDGWFNYAPYSLRPYNPGPNMDFYALGMIFLGISTTVGSANFVVTMLRMRAPGMSINRIPVIMWGTTTISVGALLSVPAVSVGFLLLWMDRQFGTHFFGADEGGQTLLWQHLFWLFAHPWVYIIVLPAMSMVSEALPVACRRPLVGESLVILATILTMVLGFGVWVHHMFATGLPFLALSFFSGASFIIVIPSAVSVFCWVATIWTGRPLITTAFLYFASFIVMFVIGGVSGVMTAAVPSDLQMTDTYFVVGHIHYVLIGINLFGVLGALYHWFPKMSGRMLSEKIGYFNFGFTFLGFNLAFLPMHWTGLMGMPRRIYTYPPDMGWTVLNMITTVGAFILAFGIFLLFVNVFYSLKRGRIAGPNPWDASTLEWSINSPPPPYNFAVVPVVASRHPLWESRLQGGAGESSTRRGIVLDDGKEALATTAIDGEPSVILKMPEDNAWPFATTIAMSAGFVGLLMTWWWLAGAGAGVTLLCVLGWLWPRKSLGQRSVQPEDVRDV
ncbi:MAG TPA: cbb3-type cytochrome c oxidase subunit I [Pararhizobium sp.]|nr:cbb3-type cytochrome c oxidase subunit I [Pararhizobium sp.]